MSRVTTQMPTTRVFWLCSFWPGSLGSGMGEKGAEGHGDFHGVRTDRGTFAENLVALDGTEITFVAPVGDEIFHSITGFGLPELVGFLGVAW